MNLDTTAYFIPTYHPSHLLRGSAYYHEMVVADLQRAKRLADAGHWEQTAKVYKVLPNGAGNASIDWAINWIQENAAKGLPCAVDTETYGVNGRSALDQYSCRLHAVGLSFCPSNEALSFLADGTLGYPDSNRLGDALRALLGNPKILKLFQNGGYDRAVLRRHGYPSNGAFQDTLVLSHVTDPDVEHDLASLSHYFLDTEPWKIDYRNLERKGQNTLERLLYYNARDALATQQLVPILMNRVIDMEQQHIAQLELQMSELAERMGEVGIPIDEDKRKQIEIKLLTNRDEALNYLRSEAHWPDFDPQKPKHRFELVYGRLNLPVKFYTKKKGEPSTGRRALIAHLDNPLVRAIMKFDENAKLLATFVAKLPKLVDDNGRLHPHWNSTGTIGSRWSSSGPNFQNWRKWLREIVTTKPGRVLVGADSKAIEYRLIAVLSGCRRLLEAFNDPSRDIHSEVAASVFGTSFTSLERKSKAWTDLRNLAKRVVYARNYRAQPNTICENLKQDPQTPMSIRAILTPSFIDKISKTFDKEYPEIGRWCEAEWDKANRTGVQTFIPLARKRFHPVLPVEITLTSNIPAQFAAGDFHNLSMKAIDEALPSISKNAYLVLTVHDQAVVECNEEDAPRVEKLLTEKMHHRVEGPNGFVDLDGEPETNRSWNLV